MLNFLTSGECRDNAVAQRRAYYLQNQVCGGYRDRDDPATSCLLRNFDELEGLITSCIGWWLQPATTCPALLLGVQTTTTCADAMKVAVENNGCCYRLLGSEASINATTQ